MSTYDPQTNSPGPISESLEQIKIILAEAQARLADINSAATQALAAKTQITDSQAVAATKSDHIQKAQEHADIVRANLDRALTATTQLATEAEGHKNRTQSAADSSNEILSTVRTLKGTVETEASTALTARKSAEDSANITKSLADKSETVEARIVKYETRIAELENESSAKLKQIVDLLPGATTVGLAHAFDDRRKSFLKPHSRWQQLFVLSVLAIVVLTVSGLWHMYQTGTTPTYDELFRLWLARLPIAGALVWLALHASRESALAKRLEEDYGYKAAIAASFLGFHKQMSEVGAAAGANQPLGKLCSDTLTTMATPPGRIYEQHKLIVSPTAELSELAKAAVAAVNASKP